MPSAKRDRLGEFDELIAQADAALGALALIVQAREARQVGTETPLEVAFALSDGAGPGLPAGLWVALRRDDIDTARDLLVRASDVSFVIGEREKMGTGYRLETVKEIRALPDVDLLQARLADLLGIPRDVLAVVAGWGPDDPRTRTEIDALLDSRFGPPQSSDAEHATGPTTLTMSVAELSDILRLESGQAKALATLARRAELTITPLETATDYDLDTDPTVASLNDPGVL